MKLAILIFPVLGFLSCSSSSSNAISNKSFDSTNFSSNTITSSVVGTTQTSSDTIPPSQSNKRIKAIDDIYLGIPKSEHYTYINKEVTLGKCTFKVNYLAYNDYPIGANFISGLYSFNIVSIEQCDNLDYLIRLFSSKYGEPEIRVFTENVAMGGITSIEEIEEADNPYTAMMYGSLPPLSSEPQKVPLYITDEKTIYPNKQPIERKVCKWDMDSLSIELRQEYKYSPIGNGKTFVYDGPKSGGKYRFEYVGNFFLQNTFTINFTNRPTEIAVKKYLASKELEKEKDNFKLDSQKL